LGLVPHLTFQIYDLTWAKKTGSVEDDVNSRGGG
jgi:hypothetical protein